MQAGHRLGVEQEQRDQGGGDAKARWETRVTVPREGGRGGKWARSRPATKVETAGLAKDQRYLL